MPSAHIFGVWAFVSFLTSSSSLFVAQIPFDFPTPKEPVLNVMLCMRHEEVEDLSALDCDSENLTTIGSSPNYSLHCL